VAAILAETLQDAAQGKSIDMEKLQLDVNQSCPLLSTESCGEHSSTAVTVVGRFIPTTEQIPIHNILPMKIFY